MTRPRRSTGGPYRRWFLTGLVIGALGGTAAFVIGADLGTTSASSTSPESDPGVVAPRLLEETATSGVQHSYEGDFEFYVGGGVAVFDCNDDGLPELAIAGGARPASLYLNESGSGERLRFARAASSRLGLPDATGVTGAYPVDIDSDQVIDLAVLRVGENILLRGLGDCRFEPANERWSFDGGQEWTVAFTATWEPEQSWPTLAVGNYLSRQAAPDNSRECATSVLIRPRSEGGFGAPHPLTPGYCTLSALFADWDGTGSTDLRMTNDRHYTRDGVDQLWRVRAGEPPTEYTVADGWQRLRIWGMGIAAQDLNGDQLPEVFLTSQADNKLEVLAEEGYPSYVDGALRRGLTAHRPFAGDASLPSTAWHPEFADVNADGWLDLFVSKGNVDEQAGFAARDPSNLLLGQPDGTFVEGARAAGLLSVGRSRGAAVVDLNLDGMLDVVEVNRRENVRLWRNIGGGPAASIAHGHWLALRPNQEGANPFAIGASLEVRTDDRALPTRQVLVGGGHASGQLGWVHVGLGEATSAQVRVTWPDGEEGEWTDVTADQRLVLQRGSGEAVPWSPRTAPD